MDTQQVFTRDSLNELIKFEIANATKFELEPIKQCLKRIERHLGVSGVFEDTAEYSKKERRDQVVHGHQENEGGTPTYVNFENCQRTDTPRGLKQASQSNPTYEYHEYNDDNVLPVNESKPESYSGESSLSSQTSLKKPGPSSRLHHDTRPKHASDDSILARNRPVITRSLSSPTHNRCEESVDVRTDSTSKVTAPMQSSMSSETSLKRQMPPPLEPRPKTTRPNMILTGRSLQTDQRRPSLPMLNKRGHQSNQADERQCLAKALQSNIEDIVDNLIFTGSELPDQLAQDSCVTDEESSDIRNIPNKKDQIRVLISTIKGRDLRVLQRFLARIEKPNKHIADKITKIFEENKRTLKTRSVCACCEMRSNVNIKYVVDGLWSIDAVCDGLYMDIARCSSSTGEQKTLWLRLIDSLNNARKDLRQVAYRRLVRALSSKNHYKYIAVDIETSISKYCKLECMCPFNHFRQVGSFAETTYTSFSPRSSISDFRVSNEKLSGTGEFKVGELNTGELAGPDASDGGEVSHDGGDDRGNKQYDSARESAGGHDPVKETPSIQISTCPRPRIVRQNAVDHSAVDE